MSSIGRIETRAFYCLCHEEPPVECCRICRTLHFWWKDLTTPFQKRRSTPHAKVLAPSRAVPQCQKRLGLWRH